MADKDPPEGEPGPGAAGGPGEPPNDPRVDRLVECVRGLVLDGNAGFAEELRVLLLQIVTDPNRPNLIMQLADALSSPSAPFANQMARLIQTFILHIDGEITNQKARAHDHNETRTGRWNYLIAGTFGSGIATAVAPLWLASAGPAAPAVALGFFGVAAFGGYRRRKASKMEKEANATVDGLQSLKDTLRTRL